MALFAAADIAVCQHGAALCNLVWSRNSASIIEIIPKERKDGISECDYFGDLARNTIGCGKTCRTPRWTQQTLQIFSVTITGNKSAARSASGILSALPKDSGSSRE